MINVGEVKKERTRYKTQISFCLYCCRDDGGGGGGGNGGGGDDDDSGGDGGDDDSGESASPHPQSRRK